jgi:hypothetical protein
MMVELFKNTSFLCNRSCRNDQLLVNLKAQLKKKYISAFPCDNIELPFNVIEFLFLNSIIFYQKAKKKNGKFIDTYLFVNICCSEIK